MFTDNKWAFNLVLKIEIVFTVYIDGIPQIFILKHIFSNNYFFKIKIK